MKILIKLVNTFKTSCFLFICFEYLNLVNKYLVFFIYNYSNNRIHYIK